jgi:hypothetical protein
LGVLHRAQASIGDANITYDGLDTGSLNPFWNSREQTGCAYLYIYFERNNIPTPSVTTIMLGDNDLSGAYNDTKADSDIELMVPACQN